MTRPTSNVLFPYTTLFRSSDFRLRSKTPGCTADGCRRGVNPVRGHSSCCLYPERQGPSCDRRRCASDQDRKSTRLNSSHVSISYAVFCFKKKKTKHNNNYK